MTFSWLRAVRRLLVVGVIVGAGSTAFGLDPQGRPQSPVENYLVRGNDGGMVMPVSHDEPVSCATGACNAVDTACCGDGSSWCGTAIDYFAPGGSNCGCNTWTVGAELLLLKAYQSDGDFGTMNFQPGFRLWAAWQRPDGLGLRARYFDYSQATGGNAVSIDSFDVEVIDSIQLGCNWTMIVGGGIRFLDLTSSQGDAFSGLGPVATAELYRTINCNTQLYAIARYSILVDGGPNPASGNPDATLSTLELQLGIQKTYALSSGALAFGRIGWEAQQYDDASDSEESITLSGLAFSLGVIY